jgi:hypothetical protein
MEHRRGAGAGRLRRKRCGNYSQGRGRLGEQPPPLHPDQGRQRKERQGLYDVCRLRPRQGRPVPVRCREWWWPHAGVSSTMVIAVPFSVKGWHAPAGRRTREPRPLAQAGQIGRLRRWVPEPGPGRRIVIRTARCGVSRLASQAGSQARPYARSRTNPRKQGRSTTNILPADYVCIPEHQAFASLCAQNISSRVWLAIPVTRLVTSGGARLGSRWVDLCLTCRVTWTGAPMSRMI